MRYLGIDYGTKRIGIALSNDADDGGTMAFPDSVILNDNNLIENLRKLITSKEVKKVVIGESKNYKMEDNAIMEDVLNLKSVIEKVFEIDVYLHPEVLTSVQAEKIQGKNDMLDASAATIILQNYMDTNKK